MPSRELVIHELPLDELQQHRGLLVLSGHVQAVQVDEQLLITYFLKI